MPQRQSIVTMDSAEVQGEGSWIKVRLITHGQQKQITAQYGDIVGKSAAEVSPERRAELQYANDALICNAVFDWNWVDDQGTPLPLPKDDPAVIDLLTEVEHQFIAGALRGEGERKK